MDMANFKITEEDMKLLPIEVLSTPISLIWALIIDKLVGNTYNNLIFYILMATNVVLSSILFTELDTNISVVLFDSISLGIISSLFMKDIRNILYLKHLASVRAGNTWLHAVKSLNFTYVWFLYLLMMLYICLFAYKHKLLVLSLGMLILSLYCIYHIFWLIGFMKNYQRVANNRTLTLFEIFKMQLMTI